MRLSTEWRADRTYGLARFAQDALDGIVGQTVRLTVEGEPVCDALVVAARVVDDGRAAEVTYEVPENFAGLLMGRGTLGEETLRSLSIDDGRDP